MFGTLEGFRAARDLLLSWAVCDQAAPSGHRAEGEAVEASADPAGDLLPPPAERPELFSGGEGHRFIIKEKKRTFFASYSLMMQRCQSSDGLIGKV